MLTIENITKLYKMDVGYYWRVGKVETQTYCYLIHLRNYKGESLQINLERNPISEQYELWYWKIIGGQSPHPKSIPNRMLLDKSKLQSPHILIEQMKQLIKNT